jgi:5'-nucleotidase
VARRATVVKQERAAVAHVLLLDAGDTLSSDRPLARQSQGKVVIEAMNLMGYDAMALGERDLQLGPQVLRQRLAEATFPFLAANLELEGELLVEPYAIREAGGHRVAIIGLTGMIPNPLHGFEVRDPLGTAQILVDELRPQADIIVLLVHVGQEMEQRLKQEIQGIDIIVGGSGQPRTSSALWDQAAGVLILPSEQPSPGHAGRLMGLARLNFDGSGRLTSHESQMISLRPDIADDPDVTLLVERYRQNQ